MSFRAPNYTQAPNEFFDDIAKTLKEGELRVLLVIMRQTFGWQKKWDRISLSQLMQKTGMERKAVHNSLQSLIQKSLIQKHKEGKIGQENCWYTLQVEPVQKDEEIPDFEIDFIDDSNNCYQYPKDTPPSILKIPTKETKSKERIRKETSPLPLPLRGEKEREDKERSESPSAPAQSTSSKRKKVKEELLEKAERVWITQSQHNNLLKKANGDLSLVEKWYEKLSVWKISKQMLSGRDYVNITNWVIKAVDQDSLVLKENKSEESEKLCKIIEKKFPEKIKLGHINIGYNYIEFILGHNCQKIYFHEYGFQERVLNNLRKMGINWTQ